MTTGGRKKSSRSKTFVSADRRRPASAGLLVRKGMLVVVSKKAFGRSFVIKKPEMVLGRSPDCDIVIDDHLLSRQHCLLTVDEKGFFYIKDLSSTNATFLNSGELKETSQLHYADRILAGNTILRFFLEEDVEKR